ncbi:sodium:solute symporter family protein [Christensenellaceae bacterium OttesenSCG-928-M15]|nr:sodium:solute symporter family protein [Christensenellaceae bacterium OttesenSCG-928-M15]
MDHSNVTMLDLIVVALYLIAMLLIGFHFVKRVKNTGDFYVAGRTLGPVVLAATVCATIIGGSAMMGRGGISYTDGMRSVMIAIPYLLGMLVFSALAGRISKVGRDVGIESIPQLIEYRYGKTAKYIIAALIGYTMMATVASQVTATATIINMLGNDIGISYEGGAIIATAVFIIYTASSGLFGVVYTDVVQFFMLLAFVYILLPISGISQAGGLSALIDHVPGEMFKVRFDGELIGMIVTNLVFTMAGAEMWQRAFAAKDRKTATRGMFWGTGVYAVTIFITLFIGLAAYKLFPNIIEEYGTADAVIPAMVIRILPAGITGLTLAGLLSVMMSSADSYLLISTQTIVNDIWRTAKPKLTDKEEMRISRVATVVLALGAMVIALYIKNAYTALMFAWTFYAASVGLPAVAALIWKKATKQGIISSILTGFVVSVGWSFLDHPPFGLGSAVPGSIACGIVLVIVSLATYKNNPAPMPQLKENT